MKNARAGKTPDECLGRTLEVNLGRYASRLCLARRSARLGSRVLQAGAGVGENALCFLAGADREFVEFLGNTKEAEALRCAVNCKSRKRRSA
jgi:hypothetical protein